MNQSVYLSRPALSSALGDGLSAHVEALLHAAADSPLQQSAEWVQGKTLAFGVVPSTLRAFPTDLPSAFQSRNNRL